MYNYYDLNTIPIILNEFKVNKIVISGILDVETLKQILSFRDESNDSNVLKIKVIGDSSNQIGFEADFINDYPLTALADLKNYDAIFINDDPNWYTVYNELKIILGNNDEFPLVFICNNVFPHKRRDSYVNPDLIPKEFINDYSRFLNYKDIHLEDDFYHAIQENTSKNGVLTAIEDFLYEYPSIGMLNFKLNNGIVVLYSKNIISQNRFDNLFKEAEKYIVQVDEYSDFIFEKKLLTSNISKFKLVSDKVYEISNFEEELGKKERIINDYEIEIKNFDNIIKYKDSQIEGFNSKLNLKDSQIKNMESKLLNNKKELNNLNNQFDILKRDFIQKEKEESILQDRLKEANNQIMVNNQELDMKDNHIIHQEMELNEKEKLLNTIKCQYNRQLSKLDTKEYCITCYQEEISNNHLEIEYLKNESLFKKFFSPFAYLYILIKSNPREVSLNYKLYKALKNSKCFDIGFYLNNDKTLLKSKWCKIFTPELHYVCNGFSEERKFNKKYFNRNSKSALLNYLNECQK